MSDRSMSRRSMLGATVAATAVAAAGSSGFGLTAGAAAGPDDPRLSTEAVGTISRLDALSARAAGEEVEFFAASSLVPNGTVVGATSVTGVRGVSPRNGVASTNLLSATVNVPAGSTLTNIEFVIEGTPQAGRVGLVRWVPDATSAFTDVLVNQTIPAATNGISVYSTALTGAVAVVDGLHTYEAFFSDDGTASTTFCNGIRVKYIPPVKGLVPITPSRAYDSRLPMTPDTNGVLASGSNRTISVASTRDVITGAITGALVPANATAIAYTLTATSTVADGYLTVNPGGNTTVGASTINWTDNASTLANTSVVKIDSTRTLTVICGGPGASANFIVDIVGYYL